MRPVRLLLALPLVLVLAGCVDEAAVAPEGAAAPRGPAPVPDFDFATAIVQGHDHGDPALHDAGFGLEVVGFSDLNEGAALPGGYTELAMVDSWAFVANNGPDRGFTVVDVSDPRAPRVASHFYPSRALGLADVGGGAYWDVSVFPEADLVVLSAQALASAPPAPDRGVEWGGGVFLVNVSDKTNPVLESFTQVVAPEAQLPLGVHNANPFEVGGERYVAATTGNGDTRLYRVVGDAPRRALEEVSRVAGMHDSAVQVHPLTGQTILYTASGGVFLWDVSDPALPVQLAFVPDDGTYRYYHETIPHNVLIDGRHYTVATTESMGAPTPFTLLDTTDPTDPVVVGEWTLPMTLTERTTPYQYSGHNLDFDRGRLYIGHQHAGVWVVDVSTPERLAAPVPLAFHLPNEAAPNVPRSPELHLTPMVWRATLHDDGLVWAIDTNSGLYALRETGPASQWWDAPVHPTNIR